MSEGTLQTRRAPPLAPPRKLLLATDLSCRCDRALDRATSLCREWGARLLIVHGIEPTTTDAAAPSWRKPVTARQIALRRLHADMQGSPDIALEVIAERAPPASLILDTCTGLEADLIVTGVARDEALGRMLLGGTVDELVARADVPVLVVKSRVRGPYRDVFVASDFGEASQQALELALSWLPRAHITMFHAYRAAFGQYLDNPQLAREAEAAAAREQAARFLAKSPLLASTGRQLPVLVENGDVGRLLKDLAEVKPVDLVVMGTRARRGLARMLLGSVAQRVLQELPGDALLVPPR